MLQLAVSIRINDQSVSSRTRVAYSGAHVLVLSTVITSPIAPYAVHSTYIGQRGGRTAATHLLLAPDERDGDLSQHEHEAHEMPVASSKRHVCLYDHLQHLLSALREGGLNARIDVADDAVETVDG